MHARMIASDLLRVVFDDTVAVDEELEDILNWEITAVDTGVEAVVKKVIFDDDFSAVSFVDLELSKTTADASYQVSVSNLKTISGGAIPPDTAVFISGRTKVDSILSSLPLMYSTNLTSNIRHILTAIGIQDEEIGGSLVEIVF